MTKITDREESMTTPECNGNAQHPCPKDNWHLYSLQALPSAKFIRVVGNILNGRFLLISPKRRMEQTQTGA
jgi:hypothetical protein